MLGNHVKRLTYGDQPVKMALGVSLLLAMPCVGWLLLRNPSASVDRPIDASEVTESEPANEPILPLPLTYHLDNRKVLLGKELFYDPILSDGNLISCSKCHDPNTGGGDKKALSKGLHGELGKVNTPSVLNSGLNFVQFWDGRASTLEDQIDGPIANPKEMGSNWPTVVQKVKQVPSYSTAFSAIYPNGVTADTIKNALASFERSLATSTCRFDRYLRGETDAITEEEKQGYILFKTLGCTTCHQGAGVGGNMYQPFGVIGNYFANRGNITEADFGRYNVTLQEADRYKFKVPSLRNVELTSPYFHDGSVAKLDDAVVIMAKYQLGISLSEEKSRRIAAFLKTLTGEIKEEK